MTVGSRIPVYSGPFKTAQAERLLWRAGFGPRPGEAAKLATQGAAKARSHSLTRPGTEQLRGPDAAGRARAGRSRPTTPGATTTSGGSTGWCGRAGRSSSG